MIVYVESNFVLEIVLGQEQAGSAEALLALAENGAIELALPAFALAEPFATITQRERARRKLVNDVSATLRDMQRSAHYIGEAALLAQAVAGLATIADREHASLRGIIQRLLGVAHTRELDSACFAEALAYQQRLGLPPQDSIIYASVITDLRGKAASDPKCFITRNSTRNSRDFDAPDIVAELAGLGCQLFFSFADGLAHCTP